MSAKKATLVHPELDYNLQYSYYNDTARDQLVADQAQQRQAITKLAEHYGIMFFYRGQDLIGGQLTQVINGLRDTYGLSIIPVSVDGMINLLLPDSRTNQGQAQHLGMKYFPAMMLVDLKQGSIRPLSYGFISQDNLAKQFLNASKDLKPNFQSRIRFMSKDCLKMFTGVVLLIFVIIAGYFFFERNDKKMFLPSSLVFLVISIAYLYVLTTSLWFLCGAIMSQDAALAASVVAAVLSDVTSFNRFRRIFICIMLSSIWSGMTRFFMRGLMAG